ncbi:MAG: glycosyltransferase [Rickettsiaceae bacterium]|nr:glycosyltransferase [Rickettsiaceae bacterium]
MLIFNIMVSRELGGIQQAYLDYNEALEEAGHTVINISSAYAQINDQLTDSIKLPTLTSWCLLSKIYLRILMAIYRPDAIIAHGGRAINFAVALKPKSVKLIGVAHNYSYKRLKKCDYVIVITDHLRQYMTDNGYDNDRIFQIPNMLRVSLNYVESKFHEPIVIGSYGRFVKQKGYEYLLDAIAMLKNRGYNARLVLGGGGEDKKQLMNKAKEIGINKITAFPGWIKDKKKFFTEIDIFCLPSIHEPFGIVLLEAMEYSKPIVSTKCEGPSEILDHNVDALLATVNSAEDLAEKLANFIDNPEKAKNCAKSAYSKLCSRYDIKVISKQLRNCISQLK